MDEIFADAKACRLCPLVAPGSAVLGPGNGIAPAAVLFIGEAPGRLGAGRTGMPFSGDESGRRFEVLLAEARLRRSNAFVTNAVLCLPLDAAGHNRRPLASELGNCAAHLAATIEHVEPQFVVTLGAIALTALGRIRPHGLKLQANVCQPVRWAGRTLVALYHPGRQAQLHRAWAAQQEDWRTLGRLIRGTMRRDGALPGAGQMDAAGATTTNAQPNGRAARMGPSTSARTSGGRSPESGGGRPWTSARARPRRSDPMSQ